jgi:SAM-dependent methyltransferase
MKATRCLRLAQFFSVTISQLIGGCRNKTTDAQSNDPAHPPFHRAHHKGIDPTHPPQLDDAEEYIAHLEKPDRAVWQKPDDVVTALGLKGSETLVDIGAGSGYFTFRFAKALPRGKVIATDTEPEMVHHIDHKSTSEGITNIQAVLIKPDDPQVTKDADWIFICNVLHHVPERPIWLGRLSSEMKPGSKLALIEFKEGKLPEGPPESAKIPRAELLSLATQAGLRFDGEKANLLPYQLFLVFQKP